MSEKLPGPSSYQRRNGAIRSFENLVALANDQERLVRDARKMVWRDRGEPAVQLNTLIECLHHANKGLLRAGTFGFTIRSGFNIFVLLFRILKLPRQFRLSLIRKALLGPDSVRFAAMLGSFVWIYKFLLNALPILLRPEKDVTSPTGDIEAEDLEAGLIMKPTRRIEPVSRRLSFKAQAHERWVRKRTRRWHAIFAGAIAGAVGVAFEKKGRRVTISQQMFVRGLQGSWNSLSAKHGIRVPFGSVILFSVCCAQIMYAFLLRPDTIPRGYSSWILAASKVTPETITINRSQVRGGTFDLAEIQRLVDWKQTDPVVRTRLEEELRRARDFGDFGPRYASCAVVHPWLRDCTSVPVDRFFSVFKWMLPVYGALHLIPTILFKRRQFVKEPWPMTVKAILGTGRSATFLGVFVVIYQTYFCGKHNLHAYLTSKHVSPKLVDLLISKYSFWLGGGLSGLSLFIEAHHRRPEFAMYVLPKAMESAWKVARGKGLVVGPRKFGEVILCAAGMGMVMSTYQHDPQHLSGLVRRILYQFVGPN